MFKLKPIGVALKTTPQHFVFTNIFISTGQSGKTTVESVVFTKKANLSCLGSFHSSFLSDGSLIIRKLPYLRMPRPLLIV